MENKDVRKLMPLLLVLTILIIPTQAAVITNPVTVNSSTFCVKFSGTTNDGIGWFEYGIDHTNDPFSIGGYKSFKTPNVTTSANYNHTICGIPLIPNQTYVVQAVGSDGSIIEYGDNETFTTPVQQPHVTTTYAVYTDVFLEDLQNDPVKIITTDIWIVYTITIGATVFYGIIIGMSILNMVTKQRSIAMAVLVVMLCSGTIWALFPPEFVMFAEILLVLGFMGIFYWWTIRRR
jgi:hypothetical protein